MSEPSSASSASFYRGLPRLLYRTSFRISWLMVLFLLCPNVGWAQSQPSNTGTITATVLDSHDNPLSGLTVTLRSIGQQSQQTRSNVMTDTNGQLSVSGCPFGAYMLVAVHNETPTLAMNPTIRGNSIATTVMLSQSFPTATLTMKFGNDMAVVSGKLKDAVTGQPVVAQLSITSNTSRQSWFSAGIPSNYQVSVPRLTDLSVKISAPGYKTWYYPGAIVQSDGRPFNQPISNKQLDIALKPAN